MRSSNIRKISMILLIFIYLTSYVSAQYSDNISRCTPNGNYTRKSPYSANLYALLCSLSSNMTGYGYYTSSVGQSPNMVNGFALCRADIVGTYGYMSPEYAMHGEFSIKSDVFSFGLLVLEILSGKRNVCIRNREHVEDLLTLTWKNWLDGMLAMMIDPVLRNEAGSIRDMVRCIHIGLLCVQEMRQTNQQWLQLFECSVARL